MAREELPDGEADERGGRRHVEGVGVGVEQATTEDAAAGRRW